MSVAFENDCSSHRRTIGQCVSGDDFMLWVRIKRKSVIDLNVVFNLMSRYELSLEIDAIDTINQGICGDKNNWKVASAYEVRSSRRK